MAALTLKDLSDDLYAKLRESAAANHRSIVAEATVLIERGLGVRALDEDELAERAKILRERTPVYLTQKELRRGVEEVRK